MDIDEKLIRLAWKRRRYVWSLQQPPTSYRKEAESSEATSAPPKRKKVGVHRDHTEADQVAPPQADYYPAAFEHMFGPLPIPPVNCTGGPGREEFPHNVIFRATDWVNADILEDKDGYDVVLAYVSPSFSLCDTIYC